MSKINKELKRFLVAGLSAVCTDLVMYYVLLNFFPIGVSKGISFLSGTIVAYLINKYWTFEKSEKSIKEVVNFGFLYSITLLANVTINKIVLDNTDMFFLSFLLSTGVSAALNFIGQKFWVFK
ncbi:MAG: GtrA family protein [Flavobacteriales bacterium]|nr:GtrA family protein [Flavobacteriales bacterium]